MAVAEAWRRWRLEVKLVTGVPLGQERKLPSPSVALLVVPAPGNAATTLSVLPKKRFGSFQLPQKTRAARLLWSRRETGARLHLREPGWRCFSARCDGPDVSLVTFEEVPASVKEVLGEQLKALQAQQGSVFGGKSEGPEGPPVPEQAALPQCKGMRTCWSKLRRSRTFWCSGMRDRLCYLCGRSPSGKTRGRPSGAFGKKVESTSFRSGLLGTPPRFKELKEKLEELAAAGAVSHSLDAFRAQESLAWQDEGDDGPEGWEASLPPDLKRAGPEIYASMKASGVRCVRDWVNSMFSVDQRHSAHYVDLFNLASLVDFKAKEGGTSQAKILSIIAQDDTCEVALRRLAAWIHERRTGDKDAAQSMLAIKPSSFSSDVAPSWLVTEAASYSQSEHKRRERARAQAGGHQGGGNSKGGEPKGGKGRVGISETSKEVAGETVTVEAGFKAILRRLWDHAKVCREGRRREPPVAESGGQSAAVRVVKGAVAEDAYARVHKKQNQVPLQAHLVAEPSDDRVVVMLEALPRSEADFYSKENHCIELTGKSRQLQVEIEEQFAFVGGTHAEYCKYFHRNDLPNNMWTWRTFADVKAIAGFSCVPKKDGITQRKLLMCCSFNFLLSDVEARSRLGMTGAGALSRLHLEQPGLQAAVCDQSNAFTSVLVPEWMIPYQAVPPIPAGDVWELLPQALRGTVGVSDWVCHVIEEEFVIEKRPIEGFFGCSDAEWWKRF
ncbi:unnamed protein product, partial [Symbiodinium sp. CCMP2456]